MLYSANFGKLSTGAVVNCDIAEFLAVKQQSLILTALFVTCCNMHVFLQTSAMGCFHSVVKNSVLYHFPGGE